MIKSELLYVSPFPPMKSGISDYSEVLIYGLKEFFHITLLIDDYKLENNQLYIDFDVMIYGKDEVDFSKFEYKIYNIGNNYDYHSYMYECSLKHPGMVILHDFVLYGLLITYYHKSNEFYPKIYELEGPGGIHILKKYIKKGRLPECHEIAHLLPFNEEIINSKNLIMSHSYYSYNKIIDLVDEPGRVRKINMIEQIRNKSIIEKEVLFDKFNIPKEHFVISSFGHIQSTKLNHIICNVINQINGETDKKVIYIMVGEGTYVDSSLNDFIIKTDYTTLDEFNSFIFHSDLIVNLRFPSMGETSASLIRALGLGKPCIVSNDAWFSELPDDTVIKINNENAEREIYNKILYFLKNRNELSEIGLRAKDYIKKNHSIDKISKEIFEFLLGKPDHTRYIKNPSENKDNFISAARNYFNKLDENNKNRFYLRPYDLNLSSYHKCIYELLNLLKEIDIKTHDCILLIGYGHGWIMEILMALGFTVDIIEISKDFIRLFQDRISSYAGHLHKENSENVTFHCTTPEECDLPDNSFDAIILYDALPGIINEDICIKRFYHLLKPGCPLLIADNLWKPGDREQEKTLKKTMAESGMLNSPFTFEYLYYLLKKQGFIHIERYHQINGLFPRASLDCTIRQAVSQKEDNRLLLTAMKVNTKEIPATSEVSLKTRARIELLDMHFCKISSTLRLKVKLFNCGKTRWLNKSDTGNGFVTLALYQGKYSKSDFREAEPRNNLPEEVLPGQYIEFEASYKMPEDCQEQPWYLDLINEGYFWFSSRQTLPLRIIIM